MQFWLFLTKSNVSMWLLILDFMIVSIFSPIWKWDILIYSFPDLPWWLKMVSHLLLSVSLGIRLILSDRLHITFSHWYVCSFRKPGWTTIWSFWFPASHFINFTQKSLLTLQFETAHQTQASIRKVCGGNFSYEVKIQLSFSLIALSFWKASFPAESADATDSSHACFFSCIWNLTIFFFLFLPLFHTNSCSECFCETVELKYAV